MEEFENYEYRTKRLSLKTIAAALVQSFTDDQLENFANILFDMRQLDHRLDDRQQREDVGRGHTTRVKESCRSSSIKSFSVCWLLEELEIAPLYKVHQRMPHRFVYFP